jgi:hypothetical protein
MSTPTAPEKSTNVRFTLPVFPLLSTLGAVAPDTAAGVAEHLLFVPRGRRRSERGDAFLATGDRSEIVVDDVRLAVWRWSASAPEYRGTSAREHPIVICLHGWAGSAAQFRTIVPALVSRGLEVLAVDAVGHGHSDGRRSSILAMRDALMAVATRLDAPVSVIAHSGGAAAATLAMTRGVRVPRAVFLGPTIDPAAVMQRNVLAAGLSARVLASMKTRIEKRFGVPWEGLRILPLAARREEPLLVVHDRHDLEVPWTEGADLADGWPGARLLLTSGLGHRRVMHDAVVADAVAQFIAGEAPGL